MKKSELVKSEELNLNSIPQYNIVEDIESQSTMQSNGSVAESVAGSAAENIKKIEENLEIHEKLQEKEKTNGENIISDQDYNLDSQNLSEKKVNDSFSESVVESTVEDINKNVIEDNDELTKVTDSENDQSTSRKEGLLQTGTYFFFLLRKFFCTNRRK